MVLLLGLVHLLYTFRGRRLHPRDADLEARMRDAPLVMTRRTTMWRAWIGFNASHSFGAMSFGAIYGYRVAILAGYAFLCWRYFFRAPLRWILIAAALYLAGLVASAY